MAVCKATLEFTVIYDDEPDSFGSVGGGASKARDEIVHLVNDRLEANPAGIGIIVSSVRDAAVLPDSRSGSPANKEQ